MDLVASYARLHERVRRRAERGERGESNEGGVCVKCSLSLSLSLSPPLNSLTDVCEGERQREDTVSVGACSLSRVCMCWGEMLSFSLFWYFYNSPPPPPPPLKRWSMPLAMPTSASQCQCCGKCSSTPRCRGLS